MIVVRYVAVALVLGAGTALVGIVVDQVSAGVRLFLRCVRWGLATGAVTGATFGASLPLTSLLTGDPTSGWLVLDAAIVGAVVGTIVSVIPTLIGATFITDLFARRHPRPSSEDDVRRELTAVFAVVVAVLDVILLVILVPSTGLSVIAVVLASVLAGNAGMGLMLWRARGSIGALISAGSHAPLTTLTPGR